MQVNSNSYPDYINRLTDTKVVDSNTAPTAQAVGVRQPAGQKKTDHSENGPGRSAGRSETRRASDVVSVSGDHHRVRRNADAGTAQADTQVLQRRPDREPPTINMIAIDPASMTPEAQKQFQEFYQRVKIIKENMPPDISQQASNFIRDRIKQSTGMDIDPDSTYINTFSGAEALQDGTDGVTGWQHKKGDMTASKTLTDFVMGGFNDTWNSATTDELNQSFGLYKSGTDAQYSANNEVKLLPSELRKNFNKGDLEKYLIQKQESFWSTESSR